MKNLLRKVYQLNRRAYHEYRDGNFVNPKTGLSEAERKRLQKYPPFVDGEAIFYDKPFHFTHASAFLHSVDEIFKTELYRFNVNTDQPYIIDCGANIGLSIYYFKKLFPKSKILAFEPDEKIFSVLKKNLKQLPNSEKIKIERKAVWIADETLEFYSEGALAGSLVSDFKKEKNIIKIEAVDFKKYLCHQIDFLKIDIEGAENRLIFDIADHLYFVQNMFLEYHGLMGEEQNLGEILNLLKSKGFQYYIRQAAEVMSNPFCGEKPATFNQQLNIFCFRNPI